MHLLDNYPHFPPPFAPISNQKQPSTCSNKRDFPDKKSKKCIIDGAKITALGAV